MARSRFCDHKPALSDPLPPCTLIPMSTSRGRMRLRICSLKIWAKPSSLVRAPINDGLSHSEMARSRGRPSQTVTFDRSQAKWVAVDADLLLRPPVLVEHLSEPAHIAALQMVVNLQADLFDLRIVCSHGGSVLL